MRDKLQLVEVLRVDIGQLTSAGCFLWDAEPCRDDGTDGRA
jgi:hypothetical protein